MLLLQFPSSDQTIHASLLVGILAAYQQVNAMMGPERKKTGSSYQISNTRTICSNVISCNLSPSSALQRAGSKELSGLMRNATCDMRHDATTCRSFLDPSAPLEVGRTQGKARGCKGVATVILLHIHSFIVEIVKGNSVYCNRSREKSSRKRVMIMIFVANKLILS